MKRVLLFGVLLFWPATGFAASRSGPRLVAMVQGGILSGYEILDFDARLTGRLGLGGGLLDLRNGGGLLVDAAITGGWDPGFTLDESLRLELSAHIWTSKGALRLFGGTRFEARAPFGGAAFGLPIAVPTGPRTAVGVVPEVGVWVGEGAYGETDVMLMVQVLFDFLLLVH